MLAVGCVGVPTAEAAEAQNKKNMFSSMNRLGPLNSNRYFQYSITPVLQHSN
jgi:hypothetical protein